MSAATGNKKAISSFFAKSKAKKPGVGGADGGGGAAGGAAGGAPAASGAAVSGAPGGGSMLHLPEFSSMMGMGDGADSGWAADTPEAAPAAVESLLVGLTRVKMHVVDAGEAEEEDEGADALRRRIEAEDTHKLLAAAMKKKKKTPAEVEAAAAAAAAAAEAAAAPGTWTSRRAAAASAASDGGASSWSQAGAAKKKEGAAPNVGSIMEFPMLPGQAP